MNNNIEMIAKDVKALSQYCNLQGIPAKKLMMQSLAQRFPELQQYYLKEMRNKNKYYVKLFEAVGMAALLEEQLSEAV